jgi:hypothetical protein
MFLHILLRDVIQSSTGPQQWKQFQQFRFLPSVCAPYTPEIIPSESDCFHRRRANCTIRLGLNQRYSANKKTNYIV